MRFLIRGGMGVETALRLACNRCKGRRDWNHFHSGSDRLPGKWISTGIPKKPTSAYPVRDEKSTQDFSDGITGYNIMVALKEYASHVKAAVHAGADLIISGAGLPTELLPVLSAEAKQRLPSHRPSTTNLQSVILKYWERRTSALQTLWVTGRSPCRRSSKPTRKS